MEVLVEQPSEDRRLDVLAVVSLVGPVEAQLIVTSKGVSAILKDVSLLGEIGLVRVRHLVH